MIELIVLFLIFLNDNIIWLKCKLSCFKINNQLMTLINIIKKQKIKENNLLKTQYSFIISENFILKISYFVFE